jgi:hypothetical protein
MSFVDDWDEHSIIYSAGIDDGLRSEEQPHAQLLPAASVLTQVNSAATFDSSIYMVFHAWFAGRFHCE